MTTRLYEANTPATVSPAVDGIFDVTVSASLFHPFKSGTAMVSVVAAWTTGQKAAVRTNVSPPMVGPGTLDGTVLAYALSLSPAGTNARAAMEIYVVSKDGATVRGTCLSIADYSTGTGFNTALRNKSWADGDTLASVAFQDQDRIVIKRGFTDVAGTTPTATARFGDVIGSTDVGQNETDTNASFAGWIEFSKNISFYSAQVRPIDTKLSVNVSSLVSNAGVPTANALQLVATWQSSTTALTAPTSCTGLGLTWDLVLTAMNGVDERLTIYRALGPSPTSGSVTVNFAGINNRPCLAWLEVTGADQSGTNGSGAIADFATLFGGPSVASPFNVSFTSPSSKVDNLVLSWFGTGVNSPTYTPRAGWGFVQGVNNGNLLNYVVYDRGNYEQTSGISYTGSAGGPFGGILEINALQPPPTVSCPTVVFVDPTNGRSLEKSQPVVFRAYASVWRRILSYVSYPARPDLGWQMIHNGTGFGPNYQGRLNSRVSLPDPAYQYRALSDGGWQSAPVFTVVAIDAQGLEAKDVDPGCVGGTGALGMPAVTFTSPASMSQVYRYTPVSFKVTLVGGIFRKIFVQVSMKGLSFWDLVYDGTTFSPRYTNATNQVLSSSGEVDFTIVPDGGWSAQPAVTVFAITDRGLEA